MDNFWDYNVWGAIFIFATLLGSLLAGNALKKSLPILQDSLIPTSVIGGGLIIVIAAIYKGITGNVLFDTQIFGGNGTATLEIITYHALALGFIASAFKTSENKLTKQRTVDIFNTGITTVSTYLLQAIVGFAITILATLFISDFFAAAGVLLPFGYGQGTGQALNYGNIYETEFGFIGGKSFGLTIAAFGFLSASFGGVIHLFVMKRKGKLNLSKHHDLLNQEIIETENEIPMQESIDKLTIQIALIFVAYVLVYLLMNGLSMLLPGMRSTIFGFNFLLGVLSSTIIKVFLSLFKKFGTLKKEYINNFLMKRASNFFYDVMVVAGIAAIRLDILQMYWGILLILGAVGLVITYVYNRFVADTLFPEYAQEQFLGMYGMLTGTASTGIILLREIDPDFKTPTADNMVYQNFPAIAFGFPMMLLATLAPVKPLLTMIILILFFIAMNLLLFRKQIINKLRKRS